MFDVFRSQRKSVKYLLTFMLLLVGVSMVITLVPGVFSTPTMDLSNPVLVEVGDERVTIRDVQSQLRRMVPPGQDMSQIMGLMAGQAIENLITDRVLLMEADRLGLKPNERQLAEWIREQIPAMFPGGQFDALQYAATVQQQFGLSVPEFERQLLTDLTVQGRLQSMIVDSVVVTEAETRAAYVEQNEQARIEYVLVEAAAFEDQVDPSEENVAAYFSANQFRYRTQEMRSVKHITFTPQPAPPGAEISEAEIRLFYDQNRFRFETQERVRPRHILFMTIDPDTGEAIPDADKESKRALAEQVLGEIRGGGDFEALANQYSEDPGTQEAGGDLGWVMAGQIGTPLFEQATFALQPGEVSEVIEAEYGFHIIEMVSRESAARRPLEEVREEIIGDLRAEKAALAEQNRTDQALLALRNATTETIDQVAADLGFSVVALTNFEQGRPPQQLGRAPELLRAVFSGVVGELIPHANADGMVAAMITEILPVRDMTLEEVGERARRDYVRAESRTLAEGRANELLEKSRESSLAEAAAELGLEVADSGPFKRAGQIDGFTSAQALQGAFSAKPGEPQGPIPTGVGFGVYSPVEVQDADMTAFVEQRSALREELLQARKTEAFEIFRSEATDRYEAEGKIQRYEARIQQFLDLASRPL